MRLKKKFSHAELRKARAAAYRYTKFSEIARFIGVDTKTLWRYRQNQQFANALKAGWKRRERQGWRAAGFNADETESSFAELDQFLESANDNFKPLEAKPGYIIEHEIIHYPDGSTREIWTQIPEPLPSLKELQKGMRRINGVYQF